MKRFLPGLLLFSVMLAVSVWGRKAPPTVRLDPVKSPVAETISLRPGQMLELALDSNPTTGYDWQIFLPETEVLIRKQGEYRPSRPVMCGSGGVSVFRFAGNKPGRTRLIGCYCRNWERPDLQKDQTFVLVVEVTSAGR